MPEGPEIRRAADMLSRAVEGKPLTNAWFAFEALAPWGQKLIGEQVLAFEPRGKALLTHFSNGMTLYSHNQLYGVWKVASPGEDPESQRRLRVRLETQDKAILLYSASNIAMLDAVQLADHPFLLRVGPDVLDPRLTPTVVRERLLDRRFCGRALGGLLLDQAFLAGLGNYLRAEILWLAQLLPEHHASELNAAELDVLANACLSVARLSYETRGQVDDNRHHGAIFHFNVFDRTGERCERCGGIILRKMVSSRPFYWCPNCQH